MVVGRMRSPCRGSVASVAGVAATGLALAASGLAPGTGRPWFDTSLPRARRVDALVGALTLDEKVCL